MGGIQNRRKANIGVKRWLVITVFICMAVALYMYIFDHKRDISDQTVLKKDSFAYAPLRPDTEKSAVDYKNLVDLLGAVPVPKKEYRIGVMVKFLGNPFWQKMAGGMQTKADELGIAVEIRASLSESDPDGQLRTMEEMIDAKEPFDLFLVSPQTGWNLIPAIERAEKKGIPIINVDGALLDNAKNWVGAPNYQKGVMAANYVIQHYPQGCKVAVIMGLSGIYDAQQRTNGFLETLKESGRSFPVAGTPHCDWDLQKASDATVELFDKHPDIEAIYCNNDTMALGVVGAITAYGKGGEVMVLGTDGIGEAYASIRRGELTATVDPAPDVAGAIAVEVALRILEGQSVPRAVYAPQKLVDKENIFD